VLVRLCNGKKKPRASAEKKKRTLRRTLEFPKRITRHGGGGGESGRKINPSLRRSLLGGRPTSESILKRTKRGIKEGTSDVLQKDGRPLFTRKKGAGGDF